MSADRLDPQRFDCRNHARIEPRRFEQAGCDNPFGRLIRKRCSRRNDETHCAGADIFALLIQFADRAQKPRENRLMQFRITGRDLIVLEPQF